MVVNLKKIKKYQKREELKKECPKMCIMTALSKGSEIKIELNRYDYAQNMESDKESQ